MPEIDQRETGHSPAEASTARKVPDEVLARLALASTATISTELNMMGYRGMFLRGVLPLQEESTMVGRAVTLRYIPARYDLAPAIEFDNSTNKQRLAVEAVGPGDVLVIDSRGEHGAGSLGAILARRIYRRGAAGIVTDGAFRDYGGIRELPMPTYAGGRNADISPTLHHPVDINLPIACGGVSILPGDVIVGDSDGVIVIPAQIAAEVAERAALHEDREEFIKERIDEGASIVGLYPPNAAALAQWQEWRLSRNE